MQNHLITSKEGANYSVLPYANDIVEGFPMSFQPLYVNYVNSTLKGHIILFYFQDIYLCLILRKKMGLTFAHLVSEIYTSQLKEIDYSFFYTHLKHFFLSKKVFVVYPPQHLHTYIEAPFSAEKKYLGIIQLPILPSLEDQFANFKTVYRRHIKAAQKTGVKVEFGIHLFDEFYEFYEARMKSNQAVYDQKSILRAIIDQYPNPVICAISRLNNKIEAVVLNIHDSKTSYYMWGASGITSHNGSFRLLHWELIQYYHSIGIKNYSLGGYRLTGQKTQKQENLENFKIGFGSQIVEGYHFHWVLKPIQYYLFIKISLLLQFIRK